MTPTLTLTLTLTLPLPLTFTLSPNPNQVPRVPERPWTALADGGIEGRGAPSEAAEEGEPEVRLYVT